MPACGSVCDRANCTETTPTPTAPLCREKEPRDPPDKIKLKGNEASLEIQQIHSNSKCPSDGLCELKRVDPEKFLAACCVSHAQEPLLQLQRSGLVRRRTERLERLSGLSQERLRSPLHTCQKSKKSSSHSDGEECSGLSGDFPKSSTPCQVRLEPLMTNEALLGMMGSGFLTPNSSPHGSTLTRSSSSNSLHSMRGKPGLVRQRAQEIETRIRLAGLTIPTKLKRSNSLAKLDNLNFSSEDLCSACSSDAGTLLLLSLSPEPDPSPEWDIAATTITLPQSYKNAHTPQRAPTAEPRSWHVSWRLCTHPSPYPHTPCNACKRGKKTKKRCQPFTSVSQTAVHSAESHIAVSVGGRGV